MAWPTRLANAHGLEYSHIVVVDNTDENILGGFCAGYRNRNLRNRHALYVVIGMRQAYAGQEWGCKLLKELEKWAKNVNVCRLELSVITSNVRAVALYKKPGYETEGVKKNAVFLQTGFVDDYIMAKLI